MTMIFRILVKVLVFAVAVLLSHGRARSSLLRDRGRLQLRLRREPRTPPPNGPASIQA